jgi:hypothetical protein
MPKCYDKTDATEILPNLWLGNYVSALSKPFLKKFNIKNIVNITQEVPCKYENNGIDYLHLPIIDGDTCDFNLNEIYDKTSQYIFNSLSKGNGVLIHCLRGHHRSASVLCAFIMRFLNISHIVGIKYINNMRECALTKNKCMVKSLAKYYVHCMNNKLNLEI